MESCTESSIQMSEGRTVLKDAAWTSVEAAETLETAAAAEQGSKGLKFEFGEFELQSYSIF